MFCFASQLTALTCEDAEDGLGHREKEFNSRPRQPTLESFLQRPKAKPGAASRSRTAHTQDQTRSWHTANRTESEALVPAAPIL